MSTMDDIYNEINKHIFIVFCQDHYNPLGLCRSLGEEGIPFIVVSYGDYPYMLKACKYVKKIYHKNSIEEAFDLIIDKYGNEKFKPFILTASDDTTLLLNNNYSKLCNKFYFFNCGDDSKMSMCMNKAEISAIAESCGIAKPKGEVLKKGAIPKNLKYPVITKVTMSTLGAWKNDVYICNNEDELQTAYHNIKADEILIQEYIDKKNELCIDGISINGGKEIWLYYTSEYIRFFDKSYGEYMRFIPYRNDEVKEKIRNIIKASNYSGVFCIECLIDKNDNLYFLEVNYRNSGWSYAYTYAGFNLVKQWIKATLSNHIDLSKIKLKNIPFTAMMEPSDFINSVIRYKQIGLWEWSKECCSSEVKFLYNKKDKKPFYAFFLKRFIEIIKNLFKNKSE